MTTTTEPVTAGNITLTVPISVAFCRDVIDTAGRGIDHWAAFSRRSDGSLCIAEAGSERGRWTDLDSRMIVRGLYSILSAGPNRVPVRSDIERAISLAVCEQDAGHIDAECADCIVQAGLLGEIRYG